MRTIKKRRARQSYSTQHFKPSPEQTPRRAYPRANILAVGTADFPRYVIIDDGKAASEDRKYGLVQNGSNSPILLLSSPIRSLPGKRCEGSEERKPTGRLATARFARLNILEAGNKPTIWEFQ